MGVFLHHTAVSIYEERAAARPLSHRTSEFTAAQLERRAPAPEAEGQGHPLPADLEDPADLLSVLPSEEEDDDPLDLGFSLD